MTELTQESTEQAVCYEERIVAFVDILGYGALVGSSGESSSPEDIIRDLESVLAENATWSWAEETGCRIKMFSDSIVLSAPATTGGLYLVILKLGLVQAGLTRMKLLVRGALAAGRHYESDSLLLSEGLVRAYHLEQSVALNPRIVIEASLISRFLGAVPREESSIFANAFILRDSDGQIFLNYMGLLHDKAYHDRRRHFLSRHRQIILEAREKHHMNPSVMSKMAWLERYHNFTVQLMDSSLSDLVVGYPSTHGFRQLNATELAQQTDALDEE